MRKIIIFLGVLFLICGCSKYDDKDLLKDISKKVKNTEAYYMTGTLEIYRNEEKYTYDVNSSYKQDNLFKVTLTNQNNNHEQIILKNEEGVYVITPSLNKSFKFQSDWPNNNSQIYLLQPILSDLENDADRIFEKDEDGYVVTSKVNYSSEKDFVNQKVYIDKDKNITKIEVLDKDNNVKMSLSITDIDYKAKFDSDYFDASKYQKQILEKDTNEEKKEQSDQESEQSTTTTSKIEDIVYPMYVPVDTQLSSQNVVQTSSGERIILTFTGESPFTVIQENVVDTAVASMDYVYGDPGLILDTVGSITDYSVSWISNGIEYSVMSDTMEIDELLMVAQSISVKTVAK